MSNMRETYRDIWGRTLDRAVEAPGPPKDRSWAWTKPDDYFIGGDGRVAAPKSEDYEVEFWNPNTNEFEPGPRDSDHEASVDRYIEGLKQRYPHRFATTRTDARLPTDAAERKAVPVCSGVLDYFPDALAAVAAISKMGNDQHNPGEPLHWARGKSMDQADCIVRHLMERGTVDTDGCRHSAKVAWRALALLQLEIEADLKLPISRGSKGETAWSSSSVSTTAPPVLRATSHTASFPMGSSDNSTK